MVDSSTSQKIALLPLPLVEVGMVLLIWGTLGWLSELSLPMEISSWEEPMAWVCLLAPGTTCLLEVRDNSWEARIAVCFLTSRTVW